MKIVRIISIAVVAILILMIGVFVVRFDANQFLPLVAQAAREQGYTLQVEKIKLALWPNLGLTLEHIQADSIAHPGPEPLASIAALTLAIPIKPLLAGQLQVDEINLKGGALSLWQNKTGDKNWAPTTSTNASSSPDEQKPSKTITIKKLALEQIAFKYHEEQRQPFAAVLKSASVQQGVPSQFNIELNGQINSSGNIPALAFELAQEIKQVDSRWQVNNGKGKMGPVDGPQLLINYHLDSDADFGKVAGAFEIAAFNPSAYFSLLGVQIADKSRLKFVAVRADFSWQPQVLQLSNGILSLDNTPINWQLTQRDGRWQLGIKASKLDVDAYLPQRNKTNAVAETGEESANADLSRLPDAEITVQIADLIIAKQPIADLNLKAVLNQKHITLAPISGRIYGGTFDGQSELNLTAMSAQLTAQVDVVEISLEPIWKILNPQASVQLTGAINANTQWQATAKSIGNLVSELNGKVQFQGDAVRIAPLNITQQYCQIISQATQRKKDSNSWPEFTQLHDLKGVIAISPTRVDFTQLHSSVDKLQLDGEGYWARDTDKFEIQLPITLVQMTNAEDTVKGCTIGSDYWVNRKLSLLQCKGKLATLDAKRDCGIDRDGVTGLLKDYALYKIKKGEGINVDHIKEKAAEKKAELREKLDATFDKEQVKKLEGKLKGLFKRD